MNLRYTSAVSPALTLALAAAVALTLERRKRAILARINTFWGGQIAGCEPTLSQVLSETVGFSLQSAS